MKKMLALFNKINFYKSGIWQFVKFSLVGISNTGVYLLIYYLFIWLNSDWYMVGSILGTVLSIANAFILNDRFVFTDHQDNWQSRFKRLLKTYISYGSTSIISNVLLWLEVAFLHISRGLAPIANLIITIPLNFVINKYWTFKK